MNVNFATIFAASCLTLSVAIPGGLYVAGEVQNKFQGQGSSRADAESLWITTPVFTLMDMEGGRHRMIAAVGTHGKQEAARLCKYLPIVRDRLQSFASSVRVVDTQGAQPTLRGGTDQLASELASALGFRHTPDIRIINSRTSVRKVVRSQPATCENGKLAA